MVLNKEQRIVVLERRIKSFEKMGARKCPASSLGIMLLDTELELKKLKGEIV